MQKSQAVEFWLDRQLCSHLELAATLAVGIWQPCEASALYREVSSSLLFAKPWSLLGDGVWCGLCACSLSLFSLSLSCCHVSRKAIRPAVAANIRSPIILLAVGRQPRATNSRSSSQLTYIDTKPRSFLPRCRGILFFLTHVPREDGRSHQESMLLARKQLG